MTKKKHLGTKAEIRAEKERKRQIATAIFLAFILLIVALSVYFTYSFLNPSQNQTSNQSSELKAAMVDHLSLTFPNQTFIQTATSTLKKAGYTVDYYPGEKVNVEFYRNLPTHGYKIIILRVHSSAAALEGKEYVEAPVSLFTSELYSGTNHVYEQLTDQLAIASCTPMPEPPYYFAITPKFVTSSTNGKFQNTLIIMMGCEGLNNTKMAEAFIEKGAKAYISWKGSVSASHTDQAAIHLLQHYLTEKQTIKQAVENTMKEVGTDPAYKSLLTYYPSRIGEQTIESINGES